MGIFDDGGQRGVCHDKSALPASAKAVGEYAEGVGVALKARYVVPHPVAQPVPQSQPGAFGEKRLYGLFAGMAERRVAEVVGQTGRGDNLTYLTYHRLPQFRTALHEP